MKSKTVSYSCDKCGKKIDGPKPLNIVTSLSEDGFWSRLHVQIYHHHGVDNHGEIEKADLCQPCTIQLLKDALQRAKAGERASAGAEDSDQKGWKS